MDVLDQRLRNLTRIESLLMEARSSASKVAPWHPLLVALIEISAEFKLHVQDLKKGSFSAGSPNAVGGSGVGVGGGGRAGAINGGGMPSLSAEVSVFDDAYCLTGKLPPDAEWHTPPPSCHADFLPNSEASDAEGQRRLAGYIAQPKLPISSNIKQLYPVRGTTRTSPPGAPRPPEAKSRSPSPSPPRPDLSRSVAQVTPLAAPTPSAGGVCAVTLNGASAGTSALHHAPNAAHVNMNAFGPPCRFVNGNAIAPPAPVPLPRVLGNIPLTNGHVPGGPVALPPPSGFGSTAGPTPLDPRGLQPRNAGGGGGVPEVQRCTKSRVPVAPSLEHPIVVPKPIWPPSPVHHPSHSESVPTVHVAKTLQQQQEHSAVNNTDVFKKPSTDLMRGLNRHGRPASPIHPPSPAPVPFVTKLDKRAIVMLEILPRALLKKYHVKCHAGGSKKSGSQTTWSHKHRSDNSSRRRSAEVIGGNQAKGKSRPRSVSSPSLKSAVQSLQSLALNGAETGAASEAPRSGSNSRSKKTASSPTEKKPSSSNAAETQSAEKAVVAATTNGVAAATTGASPGNAAPVVAPPTRADASWPGTVVIPRDDSSSTVVTEVFIEPVPSHLSDEGGDTAAEPPGGVTAAASSGTEQRATSYETKQKATSAETQQKGTSLKSLESKDRTAAPCNADNKGSTSSGGTGSENSGRKDSERKEKERRSSEERRARKEKKRSKSRSESGNDSPRSDTSSGKSGSGSEKSGSGSESGKSGSGSESAKSVEDPSKSSGSSGDRKHKKHRKEKRREKHKDDAKTGERRSSSGEEKKEEKRRHRHHHSHHHSAHAHEEGKKKVAAAEGKGKEEAATSEKQEVKKAPEAAVKPGAIEVTRNSPKTGSSTAHDAPDTGNKTKRPQCRTKGLLLSRIHGAAAERGGNPGSGSTGSEQGKWNPKVNVRPFTTPIQKNRPKTLALPGELPGKRKLDSASHNENEAPPIKTFKAASKMDSMTEEHFGLRMQDVDLETRTGSVSGSKAYQDFVQGLYDTKGQQSRKKKTEAKRSSPHSPPGGAAGAVRGSPPSEPARCSTPSGSPTRDGGSSSEGSSPGTRRSNRGRIPKRFDPDVYLIDEGGTACNSTSFPVEESPDACAKPERKRCKSESWKAKRSSSPEFDIECLHYEGEENEDGSVKPKKSRNSRNAFFITSARKNTSAYKLRTLEVRLRRLSLQELKLHHVTPPARKASTPSPRQDRSLFGQFDAASTSPREKIKYVDVTSSEEDTASRGWAGKSRRPGQSAKHSPTGCGPVRYAPLMWPSDERRPIAAAAGSVQPRGGSPGHGVNMEADGLSPDRPIDADATPLNGTPFNATPRHNATPPYNATPFNATPPINVSIDVTADEDDEAPRGDTAMEVQSAPEPEPNAITGEARLEPDAESSSSRAQQDAGSGSLEQIAESGRLQQEPVVETDRLRAERDAESGSLMQDVGSRGVRAEPDAGASGLRAEGATQHSRRKAKHPRRACINDTEPISPEQPEPMTPEVPKDVQEHAQRMEEHRNWRREDGTRKERRGEKKDDREEEERRKERSEEERSEEREEASGLTKDNRKEEERQKEKNEERCREREEVNSEGEGVLDSTASTITYPFEDKPDADTEGEDTATENNDARDNVENRGEETENRKEGSEVLTPNDPTEKMTDDDAQHKDDTDNIEDREKRERQQGLFPFPPSAQETRDEGRKDESRRGDEGRSDEGRRDEGRRDESRRGDEGRRDEGRRVLETVDGWDVEVNDDSDVDSVASEESLPDLVSPDETADTSAEKRRVRRAKRTTKKHEKRSGENKENRKETTEKEVVETDDEDCKIVRVEPGDPDFESETESGIESPRCSPPTRGRADPLSDLDIDDFDDLSDGDDLASAHECQIFVTRKDDRTLSLRAWNDSVDETCDKALDLCLRGNRSNGSCHGDESAADTDGEEPLHLRLEEDDVMEEETPASPPALRDAPSPPALRDAASSSCRYSPELLYERSRYDRRSDSDSERRSGGGSSRRWRRGDDDGGGGGGARSSASEPWAARRGAPVSLSDNWDVEHVVNTLRGFMDAEGETSLDVTEMSAEQQRLMEDLSRESHLDVVTDKYGKRLVLKNRSSSLLSTAELMRVVMTSSGRGSTTSTQRGRYCQE